MTTVELGKADGPYSADIVMKEGYGLAMSEIDKALKVATRYMGDRMRTTYLMAEPINLSIVHFLKTSTEPDEAKLKKSLSRFKGFKSVWTGKEGFGVVFQGKDQPGLAEVKRASGLKVTDVILAASKDGWRYYCPMHPHMANATALSCPLDEVKGTAVEMTKVEASTGGAATRNPPSDDKKSGGG